MTKRSCNAWMILTMGMTGHMRMMTLTIIRSLKVMMMKLPTKFPITAWLTPTGLIRCTQANSQSRDLNITISMMISNLSLWLVLMMKTDGEIRKVKR